MTVDDFIDLVRNSFRRNYLYHFTTEASIPLIKEHGLLSKSSQHAVGVECPFPGGDNISWYSDRMKGIFNDVSISFTHDHPMAYVCRESGRHLSQFCLSLSLEVLRLPGVRVADGMANAKGTKIYPLEHGLDLLDLEVLYKKLPWIDETKKRLSLARKYEVLVPSKIPVSLIKMKKKMT